MNKRVASQAPRVPFAEPGLHEDTAGKHFSHFGELRREQSASQ
jgi:hypothetical protein